MWTAQVLKAIKRLLFVAKVFLKGGKDLFHDVINLLIATGEGGNAPGTVPAAAVAVAVALHAGAEFLGVVELDTGADEVGTLTG